MIINHSPTMHALGERSVLCARCEKPIQDRFLLNVLERPWHCKCVQCSDCGCSLTEKCFSRDGQLYCKDDFFRRFGTKCGGCGQGISPNDLVRRAREKVFHLKCFTCMVCRKQLSTGEELYVLDENKFICKDDYLASKYSQGSDMEDDDEGGELNDNLLDKLDDNLSEKGSSFHDDDSIDSGLPPMGGIKMSNGPGGLTPALIGQGDFPFGKTISTKDSSEHTTDLNKNNAQFDNIKIKDEPIDKNVSLDKNDNPKLLDSMTDKENKSDSSSCKGDGKDSEDDKVGGDKTSQSGTKRRGPRTTIKAKQLETLKAAFAATPKPTRHIREQLAQETGLNMRVIQVWFQNRRSKERRMKQLSALGARRAFFRNPRRMRGLDDGSDLMGPPGFGYFGEGEFYPNPGFPGFPGGEYAFPPNGDMGFMPPGQGPPLMDGMHPGHMHDPQFGMPPNDMIPPPPSSASSTPDGTHPSMQPLDAFAPMPPRSMPNSFTHQIGDNRPPPEMTPDSWLS